MLIDERAKACGMTAAEAECFQMTGDLTNKFACLPALHPADMADVCDAIHAIQSILMSRPFYRKYTEK